MKIEQLLVQHFYNTGEVTLQGMGTFTLSPDFVFPMDNEKDVQMPDNAISFQYDSRATEDGALINFIVQQTRKMRSLASADLDSYLMLGKQFLNIGKPFQIDGLGLLVKNQQGEYEFTQGHSFNTKLESTQTALKEKREDPEISFSSESKSSSGGKKGLLITAIIIVIGLIGSATWYFLLRNNNTEKQTETVQTITVPDTAKAVKVIRDTLPVVKPDTLLAKNDYTFNVVFMVTKNLAAATYRMNVLTTRGHKIIMYSKDSVLYKLAEPFSLPLSDTTKIKDSLNNFYYLGKAFIERK